MWSHNGLISNGSGDMNNYFILDRDSEAQNVQEVPIMAVQKIYSTP